ncbi:MAG: hypothetical protein ACYTGL_19710 [Planctomycetota bacterium]|jgi:hypothetical protein
MYWIVAAVVALLLLAETVVVALVVRRKNLDRWLPSYLFGMHACPRLNQPVVRPVDSMTADNGEVPGVSVRGHQTPWTRFVNSEPLHVFIAVCDHYEPDNARPARYVADTRVDRWCSDYPALFEQFADSSGRPPQHSFFFPQDEYFVPEYLDQLRDLCEAGFGDVEIHLHHDDDTEDGLREKLESFRDTLHHRHGLLRRHPETGELTYGFIHGNWALCNSRPDGRWCGVNNELTVLRQTGCYADFTLPSAPEATQTRIVNSIYYASSDSRRPKGHDRGTRATLGVAPPAKHLMLVQGPLTLDWDDRRRGVIPRIENGDLLHRRPPTLHRFEQWLKCGVHVAGRPDWCFIKLHTHGCKDGNIDTLLGEQTQQFHRDLAAFASGNRHLQYHYVTAWEMARLIKQAESGVQTPNISVSELVLESVC